MKNIQNLFIIVLFFYLTDFCFALTGAKYLIVVPDNYVSAVQPLADWKTKKGVKAMVLPLSVIGNSSSQIKTYIQNAYNNWDIKPEYILVAGSSVPYSGSSDDYYADMTGNLRIELSVGRFPCSSVDQINNLVAKTLMFERTPYLGDSTWFIKGTTIVREDNASPPDNVFWENARYIHNHWLHRYYMQIDSFSSARGNNSTNVSNSINNGRIFIVFRGESVTNWWSPFAMTPGNLTNGNKTPIVISGTCATASITQSGYLGDAFVNAGTTSNPKGAVGFFGTTVVASGSNLALNRGVVSKGFFQAIFEEGIFKMGDAARRAKFIVDSLQPPSYTTTRYSEWQLFGDPELNIWTAIPKPITVIHDTIIETTPQTYNVSVSQEGHPVSNALVCLMMDTTIYHYSSTNSSGNASFNISPTTIGTMSVTVTALNAIPYERNVIILATGISEGETKPLNIQSATFLNAPNPNPMTNGQAIISFNLAEPSRTSLKIYDASGGIVKTLLNNQLEQGFYNFTWNGKDDNNRAVNEGIYFYTLETPKQKFTKKLVLTK